MEHSYLKKVAVFQGKITQLNNALVNIRGDKKEMTSEGKHMLELKRFCTKVNFRAHKVLTHSPVERRLRKKIIKLGANKNFAVSTMFHPNIV